MTNAQVVGLQADVEGLRKLETNVGQLKGEVSVLQKDFSELKGEVSELKGEVSDLNENVDQLTRRLRGPKGGDGLLKAQVVGLAQGLGENDQFPVTTGAHMDDMTMDLDRLEHLTAAHQNQLDGLPDTIQRRFSQACAQTWAPMHDLRETMTPILDNCARLFGALELEIARHGARLAALATRFLTDQ